LKRWNKKGSSAKINETSWRYSYRITRFLIKKIDSQHNKLGIANSEY
jgi:hypothetical protein